MANLLPKENRELMWRAFVSRFVIVVSLALIVLAIFSYLALLPSYIIVRGEGEGKEAQSATSTENQKERDELLRSQRLLSRASLFIIATSSSSSELTRALSFRPDGISIQRVNITPGIDGVISILGSAENREAVSHYRDALIKSGLYKNVSVPVDALVGAGDGTFTITILGAF